MTQSRPKIAETIIDPSVSLREAVIGRHCEVLERSHVEHASLGDFSYLGPDCIVADAEIGKFCAIAARVRIGAPNHPIDRPSLHRFTYCPDYYSSAPRDTAFFATRRDDRVRIGHDVWIGHAVTVLPGVTVGDGAVLAAAPSLPRMWRPTPSSAACRPSRSASASPATSPQGSHASPGGTGRSQKSCSASPISRRRTSRRSVGTGKRRGRLLFVNKK